MKTVTVVAVAVLFSAGIGDLRSEAPRDSAGSEVADSVRLINSIDGQALYQAYCAVCHGTDARGAGPMASSLKVLPADLTRVAARHGGTYPDALIQRIISGEATLPAGHGTSDMPVWGPIFSQVTRDQDLGLLRIHNLSTYIRRLQER